MQNSVARAKAFFALLLGAFVLGALPLPAAAQAQNYPNRPVRLVVPFPPGGIADVVARVVGQKLAEAWGQQAVIDNRTGASGTLGADAVAKATPDGYTLLLTTGDFITTPTLMPKMAFDPYKDLIPIIMIARGPLLLGANSQSSIGSLNDLLTEAKAKPGTIAFSSPGNGTINHLAVEWLAIEAGLKLLHVPYRGGVPAAVGVAAGDVPIGALTPSSAAPFVEAGKVKILALMTKQRPSFTPLEWPTLAEKGFPVDAALWVGLFAPTGTPEPILNRLNDDVARILQDETVRQRLNSVGTEASAISRADFVERIRADAERYSRVIEQVGIRIQP
jgi:tripartite-type tricarboxylate transporter receptor subunit TctC